MSEIVSESEVRDAIAELDKIRGDLMARPGVTAVDVGLRYRGGELTHELAIRVHVERKLPPEALDGDQLLPEKLGRFPIDVIEATYGPQAVPSESEEVFVPAGVVEVAYESQEALPEVGEALPSVPGSPESND